MSIATQLNPQAPNALLTHVLAEKPVADSTPSVMAQLNWRPPKACATIMGLLSNGVVNMIVVSDVAEPWALPVWMNFGLFFSDDKCRARIKAIYRGKFSTIS